MLWLTVWIGLLIVEPARGTFEVSLTTETHHPRHAKLYFDRGNGLNEADSTTAWIRPDGQLLRFSLPAGKIQALRLDLLIGDTPFRLHGIQTMASRLASPTPIPLSRVRIDERIGILDVTPLGMTATLQPEALHPELIIEPTQPIAVMEGPPRPVTSAISAAILTAVLLAVWRFVLARIWSWHVTLTLGLIIVFVLVWTMAWTSPSIGKSLHPDEHAHLWCYQFYLDHLWPLAVDDPALVRSISIYGFSYLFELDVVYFLAARTKGAFSGWFASDVMAARSFNLTLLLGLTCLALLKRRWTLGLSVLLLSPQIWYLFSYFNADALPLTLAMIAACIVADEKSGLNRFLDGNGKFGAGALVFTLALGLLLISKRTFLPVIPVLGLWLAVLHLDMRLRIALMVMAGLLALGTATHLKSLPDWPGSISSMLTVSLGMALLGIGMLLLARDAWCNPALRPKMVRLVTIFGLGVVIATPWVLGDIAVNGTPSQKMAAMAQVAEMRAHDGFKPSQLAGEDAYHGRAMAQREVTLSEIAFAPNYWLQMSQRTAFGVYGYVSVYPPIWILHSLLALTLAMIALVLGSLVHQHRRMSTPLLAIFFGGCILIGTSSLLHSWVTDFQPQGRYLFSILPMLTLAIGTAGKSIPRRLFVTFIACAFLLGCVSFVGFGMPALADTF